jgi:hypothetical protein
MCNWKNVSSSDHQPSNLVLLILSRCQMQEHIPVTQLVRETAAVMQEFTQSGYVTRLGNLCWFV